MLGYFHIVPAGTSDDLARINNGIRIILRVRFPLLNHCSQSSGTPRTRIIDRVGPLARADDDDGNVVGLVGEAGEAAHVPQNLPGQ